MSTKTLRKRIALVAVSALTAGLVSVAPAANAAGAIDSIGGIGQLGTLVNTDVLAQSATYLTTGTIVIESDGGGAYKIASGSASVIAVWTGNDPATPTLAGIDADGQGATLADGDAVVIRPTGAAGSTIVIKGYDATPALVSRLTITLASSSVAGVVSPSKSQVTWVAGDGDDPAVAGTDDTGASTTTTGLDLFLNIKLKDAYGAAIEDAGALVVTVSGAATVAIGDVTAGDGDAVGNNGAYTTAVSGLSPEDINVRLGEKTVGTGWAGTVTVTFNGTTITSKTGKITGAEASVTVTPAKVAKADGTSSADAFKFVVKDSAGNVLDVDASSYELVSSSGDLASVAVGNTDGDATNGYTNTGNVTCDAAGSTDIVIGKYVGGEMLKSNSFKMLCGGTADSYTASFDKAVYAQGDIATLTISFKDAKGNVANSYDAVSDVAADQTIASPMMERVGGTTYTAAEKTGVAGTVTHKFTVGSSSFVPGKFNAIVTYPTPANGAAQTVGYEVTSSVGGVSNADVLKAIVSLIASINKQIAALQKALLKKK